MSAAADVPADTGALRAVLAETGAPDHVRLDAAEGLLLLGAREAPEAAPGDAKAGP